MYRRTALSSTDEVLVLEVGHFDSVEKKGLALHVMLGFFTIAASLIGPYPESIGRDKDHGPLVEFILQFLALDLEGSDLLALIVNAEGDFPYRVLRLGDLVTELLPAV